MILDQRFVNGWFGPRVLQMERMEGALKGCLEAKKYPAYMGVFQNREPEKRVVSLWFTLLFLERPT